MSGQNIFKARYIEQTGKNEVVSFQRSLSLPAKEIYILINNHFIY
jgi:hypothetical protein